VSFWTAMVVIVAIAAFVKMRSDRLRYAADKREVFHADERALSGEAERELADLRKRLEVLERIVTDERGPHRLSSEIDALRDR